MSGAWTLGTVPSGYTCSLDTSTAGKVNLVVQQLGSLPSIGSVSLGSGGLVLSGSNGVPNGTYYVLSTNRITAPLATWPVISTNTYAPDGTFRVTNAVDPAKAAGFFRIKQ